MKAVVISIGNEILIGDTVNTNAAWLGRFLSDKGINLVRVHTIGDELERIKSTIADSFDKAELVITTGGLGPTHDDITKTALKEFFDSGLRIHEPTLKFIKKIFAERNIPFSQSNYHQAEVLDNCEVMINKRGTAPGMWFEHSDSYLAVLPGIPYEMKHLMKEQVWPKIMKIRKDNRIHYSRYIVTAGIGESTLSDHVIGNLKNLITDTMSIAFLPSPWGTKIRITNEAESRDDALQKVDSVADYIWEKAEKYIIGEGENLTISEALGNLLREKSLTISCAESCTGGLLSDNLTDIPGSSDYLVGGIVAYSNDVKMNSLDVKKEDLENFGAVSKEVALQMARGIASVLGSDIGISTTGIAGPGGGTSEKPVGTVWIGYWSAEKHFAIRCRLTKDRRINKERSVAIALETVRRAILQIEPMPYGLEPYS